MTRRKDWVSVTKTAQMELGATRQMTSQFEYHCAVRLFTGDARNPLERSACGNAAEERSGQSRRASGNLAAA
jgi:hypothetical protein